MIAWEWAVSQYWATSIQDLDDGLRIAARANDAPEIIEARLGRPLENTHKVTIREEGGTKVAVVPIDGPIFAKANYFTRISGGVSTRQLALDIQTVLDDPEISSIILKMNSPGGEVTGTSDLAEQIYKARSRKPIVMHGDGQVCSGGYWIGSAAHAMVVSPTTLLGSIGVVRAYQIRDDSKDKVRTVEYVSTHAPYKRFDPASDTGKALIQRTLDDLHTVFESKVARNRGTSRKAVRSDFGQGGVKVGVEAVKAGMADGIMTFEDCLAELVSGRMPGKPRMRINQNPQNGGPDVAKPNSWKERYMAVKSLFVGSADEDLIDDPDDNAASEPPQRGRFEVKDRSMNDPEKDELRRKVALLEEANAKARVDTILAEAATFVDGEIAAGRAIPAERDSLLTSYAQSLLDDAGIAQVAGMADGKLFAGSPNTADAGPRRAEAFRTAMKARLPHTLKQEKLPNGTRTMAPQHEASADGDDPDFDAALKRVNRFGHVKN